MTVTWNNRKLASVVYLAGADADGSLWAVSKTMKYIPAPEWTGRHVSPYSKSRFKHHWLSGPPFSPCSDLNAEALDGSFDSAAEFHWHLNLPIYSAVGFPHHIHQHSDFPCEQQEREGKVNFCMNSKPLLGVWEGVLENPNFATLFCLSWNMQCFVKSVLQNGYQEVKGNL